MIFHSWMHSCVQCLSLFVNSTKSMSPSTSIRRPTLYSPRVLGSPPASSMCHPGMTSSHQSLISSSQRAPTPAPNPRRVEVWWSVASLLLLSCAYEKWATSTMSTPSLSWRNTMGTYKWLSMTSARCLTMIGLRIDIEVAASPLRSNCCSFVFCWKISWGWVLTAYS